MIKNLVKNCQKSENVKNKTCATESRQSITIFLPENVPNETEQLSKQMRSRKTVILDRGGQKVTSIEFANRNKLDNEML